MLDSIKNKTFLLISTVRYCLGRQTYAVAEINTLLKRHWEDIPRNDRMVILKDIKEYKDDKGFSSIDEHLWDEILVLGIRDGLILEN